VVLRDDA
jgi:hypothetical protein